MIPSFVTTVTTALLLAGTCSAAGLLSSGTLLACQSADLGLPCANVTFVPGQCTGFPSGYNDKVRSVAAGEGMALYRCTFYQENCVNPGKNVTVQDLLTPVSTVPLSASSTAVAAQLKMFNMPTSLENDVSNFLCELVAK
ncbi:hypothetical protein DFH06DRAFT_1339310 [Mycena polygramma]|nr:hypothetical protein DFH06DRAFT_1339310 [Mycena polygramma]